jgi:hypothetical protein
MIAETNWWAVAFWWLALFFVVVLAWQIKRPRP